MRNAFFFEEELSTLFRWDSLRLVSSDGADIPPIEPPANYLTWLNENHHRHRYREVVMALSGTTCLSLGGLTYACGPGTVLLIGADEDHDFYYPCRGDDFRHLWFRLVNKTLLTCGPFYQLGGRVVEDKKFCYIFAEHSHAVRLFIDAWDELSDDRAPIEFRRSRVKHAFTGLALELCGAGYGEWPKDHERGIARHQRVVINAIVEHIKGVGGRKLDIAELAYLAGYSKFHFARLFKEITGVTAHKFINSARVETYRELSSNGLSKKQISGELGFSSPAAFSRWCRDNLPTGKREN